MARDSSGTKNQPQYSATGVSSQAADLSEVANYAAAVGNRKADTSTNRTNATGADVWEGLRWYETDTGDEYIRYSGSWVLVDSRGTLSMPAANSAGGWSFGSGNQMYRVGRELHFHWNFTKNAAAANADLIMVLPTGQRPLNDTEVVPGGSTSGGAESAALITVSPTDGGVRILGTPNAGARGFRFTSYFVVA